MKFAKLPAKDQAAFRQAHDLLCKARGLLDEIETEDDDINAAVEDLLNSVESAENSIFDFLEGKDLEV